MTAGVSDSLTSIDPPSSRADAKHWLIVAALLVLFYGLALSATLDKCTCYDEIAHLTAGYSYWLFNDYRLQPENGNLPQRWAALPLLTTRPTFPDREQLIWQHAHVWKVGREFFYKLGNDADRLLLQGRAMMALLGVALGLLVYGYARRLFGPGAGLLSLALFVLCPNLLAHAPLINSDMAACLFFLASLAAIWWVLHEFTWARFAVSSLILGGLFLAKFSAVIMVPVMVLLALLRVLDGRPLPVRLWGAWPGTFVLRRQQGEVFLGLFLLQGIAVLCLIWAFFGFRYSAFHDYRQDVDEFHAGGWETVAGINLPEGSLDAILWARQHQVLPEAYIFGFTHTLGKSQSRHGFLNGATAINGWRSFFPYAFLVKTPLSNFVVFALAILSVRVLWKPSAWRESWRGFYDTAPLWIFLVVYWVIAINSRLNIGHRHILPTYSVMYVLAGSAACWLVRSNDDGQRPRPGLKRGLGALLLAALAWTAFEATLAWPNYLAYFNQVIGGPRYGYRHLVDSSLDWGQDLPALKRWLDRYNPVGREPVRLAYFGMGLPEYYGIAARPLIRPLERDAEPDLDAFTPGIYAISATYFQGVYLEPRRPWDAYHEEELEAALPWKRWRDAAPSRTIALAGTDPLAASLNLAGEAAAFKGHRREYLKLPYCYFAKLCTYLQDREPDDEVNFSILIFRLDEMDLRQAFEVRHDR